MKPSQQKNSLLERFHFFPVGTLVSIYGRHNKYILYTSVFSVHLGSKLRFYLILNLTPSLPVPCLFFCYVFSLVLFFPRGIRVVSFFAPRLLPTLIAGVGAPAAPTSTPSSSYAAVQLPSRGPQLLPGVLNNYDFNGIFWPRTRTKPV